MSKKKQERFVGVVHVHVYFYPKFFEIETTGIDRKK